MLEDYSHIRIEPKRSAFEPIVTKPDSVQSKNHRPEQVCEPGLTNERESEAASLQNPYNRVPKQRESETEDS